MSYWIPVDLDKKPAVWTPLSFGERIKTVCEDQRAYPLWALRGAVAISLLEQPGSVPCGNIGGIMCQGEAFDPTQKSTSGGWGWGRGAWNRAGVKPSGYAVLKEGLSGRGAPFLTFASAADSLRFICQQCFEDGGDHYDGESYALHWFGIAPGHVMWDSTVALFDRTLAQVVKAWPVNEVAGYRDAGASK